MSAVRRRRRDGADSSGGVRVLVYDDTGVGKAWFQTGLTNSWRLGAALYKRYPPSTRVHHTWGARSWEDALAFVATIPEPIGEIQYWGHGLPGRVMIADDVLDVSAFDDVKHPRHQDILSIASKLTDDALVWWRTCGAFAGAAGQRFAQAQASVFGATVAGHTHVIGPLQSGLHTLQPGAQPRWSVTEGLTAKGSLLPSSPSAPHTIHFLQGAIPKGW